MLYNKACSHKCISDKIIIKVITFIFIKTLTLVITYDIIIYEKICLGGS